MKTWTVYLGLCLLFSVCGCAPSQLPRPFQDPRDAGPFMATSDFPNPPNVEATASSEACSGEPLRAVSAPLPDYPARGWNRGLQGWVIVQFDVRSDGFTENVQVARGVPGGSFDAEAARAVNRWQFQPLSTDDARLSGCVVLFEFRITETKVEP